ncbi:unnamed protein product [Hydatigera taeniaeformis]|uniref:Secreted protein n=1 Tax=Hydatigena taeniaeformis TaxID=6205 RepID=A0A0R3XCJ0_HYDTA|nr:unnamed protein product [Hydatigera taeniaeformis]
MVCTWEELQLALSLPPLAVAVCGVRVGGISFFCFLPLNLLTMLQPMKELWARLRLLCLEAVSRVPFP